MRVGIIIDSFMQPRWVRKAIENVLAAHLCKLASVIKVPPAKTRGSFLYRLYDRLDFEANALELVNIEDVLDGVPLQDGFEGIKDLDLILNFGPRELNAKVAGLAKHGVWFYELDGFREVMNHEPIMISSLRSLSGEPPTERVIYQSVAPTLSRFSVGLNNNTCYWKSAAFVARGLADLAEGRAAAVAAGAQSPIATPGNAAMARMFLKLSGRAAARAFEKFSSTEQWVLAYRLGNGQFRYLIPPADRFWADPFPMTVAGRHYIFLEEFLSSTGKAHISVIEVDQNGITSGPTEVLKLECHLSYPFVFEWQGDYYMVPETGDKNVVELYRATSFPFEWQPVKVLLEANHPLDATLVEVDGAWWMFVNVQEEGVAVNWDELHLYYAESPLGPWQPHARNPIVSDVRSARPAGRLFRRNNVLYRPGQDSSLRYGYATTISAVITLTTTEYEEKEVFKILPDWGKDIIGIHTFNLLDEITAIDCLVKRSRFRQRDLHLPGGSLDLPFVG